MCKPFTGNSQKSWTAYLFAKYNEILANFMQKHHFHLKFCAANIVFPCIWMNTILNYGFLQKKSVLKIPPTPKPYGPGFNMQYFPNIFILLGAPNVRL